MARCLQPHRHPHLPRQTLHRGPPGLPNRPCFPRRQNLDRHRLCPWRNMRPGGTARLRDLSVRMVLSWWGSCGGRSSHRTSWHSRSRSRMASSRPSDRSTSDQHEPTDPGLVQCVMQKLGPIASAMVSSYTKSKSLLRRKRPTCLAGRAALPRCPLRRGEGYCPAHTNDPPPAGEWLNRKRPAPASYRSAPYCHRRRS